MTFGEPPFECSQPKCKKQVATELDPAGRPITPKGWRWVWCHAGAFAVCETCTPPVTGTMFEEDFPDAQ